MATTWAPCRRTRRCQMTSQSSILSYVSSQPAREAASASASQTGTSKPRASRGARPREPPRLRIASGHTGTPPHRRASACRAICARLATHHATPSLRLPPRGLGVRSGAAAGRMSEPRAGYLLRCADASRARLRAPAAGRRTATGTTATTAASLPPALEATRTVRRSQQARGPTTEPCPAHTQRAPPQPIPHRRPRHALMRPRAGDVVGAGIVLSRGEIFFTCVALQASLRSALRRHPFGQMPCCVDSSHAVSLRLAARTASRWGLRSAA